MPVVFMPPTPSESARSEGERGQDSPSSQRPLVRASIQAAALLHAEGIDARIINIPRSSRLTPPWCRCAPLGPRHRHGRGHLLAGGPGQRRRRRALRERPVPVEMVGIPHTFANAWTTIPPDATVCPCGRGQRPKQAIVEKAGGRSTTGGHAPHHEAVLAACEGPPELEAGCARHPPPACSRRKG